MPNDDARVVTIPVKFERPPDECDACENDFSFRCEACGTDFCGEHATAHTAEQCPGCDAKPAPAPLRYARRIAHEACLTNVDGKGLAGCPRAPLPGESNELQHTELCNRVTAAIIADRAARPDVAQLRGLLEEGARLADMHDNYQKNNTMRAWARRVREVLSNSVDGP